MKANELRIGNWVRINDYGIKIESIFNEFISWTSSPEDITPISCPISSIQPIPLTEEILKKINLEYKFFIRKKRYSNDKINFCLYKNGRIDMEIFGIGNRIKFTNIQKNKTKKYVHQLQNLYFALTGEELELSDKQ